MVSPTKPSTTPSAQLGLRPLALDTVLYPSAPRYLLLSACEWSRTMAELWSSTHCCYRAEDRRSHRADAGWRTLCEAWGFKEQNTVAKKLSWVRREGDRGDDEWAEAESSGFAPLSLALYSECINSMKKIIEILKKAVIECETPHTGPSEQGALCAHTYYIRTHKASPGSTNAILTLL